MENLARRPLSWDEYVALEAATEVRHEWFEGEAVARAGGSVEHATVCGNLYFALRTRLGSTCQVFGSDLRVAVDATGLVTHPDVTVVCGAVERWHGRDAVANPTLLAEVLSPSTRNYDQGDKFAHYRRIPTLRAVLFVEVGRRHGVLARRMGDLWQLSEHTQGVIPLPELGDLPLAELYVGLPEGGG